MRYDLNEILAHKNESRPIDMKCETCGSVHAHLIKNLRFQTERDEDRNKRDPFEAFVQPGQLQADGLLKKTCGPARWQSLMPVYRGYV